MKQLKIEIKGEGTKEEIYEALKWVARSIKNTISLEEQAEVGIEWEDKTLMTNIKSVD